MKYIYKPKTKLERFGFFIYQTLVENFPQTFYVGGMVRDFLLGKNITDIDIATSASPQEVIKFLNDHGILHDESYVRFGIIVARQGAYKIEIATFRKDLPGKNRYAKISFVKTAQLDSNRRDFTINALYLSPKRQNILDFQSGLRDLKSNTLRFIGKPEKRIKEDPLRIIRALRFAETLGFVFDNKTERAIKNNFFLVGTLTKTKIKRELEKIKNQKQKKSVLNLLDNKNLLDIKPKKL